MYSKFLFISCIKSFGTIENYNRIAPKKNSSKFWLLTMQHNKVFGIKKLIPILKLNVLLILFILNILQWVTVIVNTVFRYVVRNLNLIYTCWFNKIFKFDFRLKYRGQHFYLIFVHISKSLSKFFISLNKSFFFLNFMHQRLIFHNICFTIIKNKLIETSFEDIKN